MKSLARLVWILTALVILSALASLAAMMLFDYTSPLYQLTQILPILTTTLYTALAFTLIPLVSQVYRGAATPADTRTAWLAPLVSVGVMICICAPGIIMLSMTAIDF